eukprot:jgi/Bigna1/138231/aug1.43_g12939
MKKQKSVPIQSHRKETKTIKNQQHRMLELMYAGTVQYVNVPSELSFSELRGIIATSFPSALRKLTIRWLDEEKEAIIIQNTRDLKEALEASKGELVASESKVNAVAKDNPREDHDASNKAHEERKKRKHLPKKQSIIEVGEKEKEEALRIVITNKAAAPAAPSFGMRLSQPLKTLLNTLDPTCSSTPSSTSLLPPSQNIPSAEGMENKMEREEGKGGGGKRYGEKKQHIFEFKGKGKLEEALVAKRGEGNISLRPSLTTNTATNTTMVASRTENNCLTHSHSRYDNTDSNDGNVSPMGMGVAQVERYFIIKLAKRRNNSKLALVLVLSLYPFGPVIELLVVILLLVLIP